MRIIADLILLISILYLPAWVAILMIVSFAFVFNSYYEALLFGFLADRLYAPGAYLLNAYALEYFMIALATLVVVELLKGKLTYYPG